MNYKIILSCVFTFLSAVHSTVDKIPAHYSQQVSTSGLDLLPFTSSLSPQDLATDHTEKIFDEQTYQKGFQKFDIGLIEAKLAPFTTAITSSIFSITS